MTTVSVIIPAYNAAAFIEKAIRSVCVQTLRDFEIIVIDDASTDDTSEVVQALARNDARIKLIIQEQNSGPGIARNRGINNATGKWIALLDADDSYFPRRLETLVAYAEQNYADLAADNVEMFDFEGGTSLGRGFDERFGASTVPLKIEDLAALDIMTHTVFLPIGYAKPIMLRSFLNKHAIRYSTDFIICEDFFLYACCIIGGGRFILAPQIGYRYAMRGGSLSRSGRGQADKMAVDDRIIAMLPRSQTAGRRAFRRHKAALRYDIARADLLDGKVWSAAKGAAFIPPPYLYARFKAIWQKRRDMLK